MSNSPLVTYTKLSPHTKGKRTLRIERITPHCVVGQCSIEALGAEFSKPIKNASSNYGIDKDGRIGMFVPEDERSICSSSSANDNRAVTIECASDMTAPWAFRPVVYETLIRLCIDICQRNDKTKLIWISDKAEALAYQPKQNEMLLTVHRWFATDGRRCPGDWMMERMGELAQRTNLALNADAKDEETVVRYSTLTEIPKWGKEVVKKLCDRGIIQGRSGNLDENLYPTDLDLSDDMLRILVWNERSGLYD